MLDDEFVIFLSAISATALVVNGRDVVVNIGMVVVVLIADVDKEKVDVFEALEVLVCNERAVVVGGDVGINVGLIKSESKIVTQSGSFSKNNNVATLTVACAAVGPTVTEVLRVLGMPDSSATST